MNILQLQERLKDLPDNALMQEMQMPTGNAPQFLVLSELKRRKRMRDEYKRQEAADMPTVAEEVVTAAGMPQEGIMGAARAMAPNTNVAQNTGMDMAAPVPATRAPQMMADGGILRYAPGGTLGGTATAIAMLRENYPDVYEQYKDDPNALAYAAAQLAESARTPELTGLEELEAPRDYDLLQSLFTDPTLGEIKDQQKKLDPEREIKAQIATQQILRDRADDEGLFAEGSVAEYLRGTPEGGFPRTSEAYGIEGDLVSPELDDFVAPTAASTDAGLASLRAAPTAPSFNAGDSATIQGSPTTDFSLEPGSPAETDAIREYLRGEGSRVPGLIDAIDNKAWNGVVTSDRAINDDLGSYGNLLLGTSTTKNPIANMLNRRAQEYLQSDMYTPPEEVYSGSPYDILKYTQDDDKMTQEEKDAEFFELSQRLFTERQAADAAAEQRAIDLDAQLQAEGRAAERIGDKIASDQPEEPVSVGEQLASFIAGKVGEAQDYLDERNLVREADKSSEVVLGEGAEITPQKGPEATAAQQEIENLRNQIAELSKSGSGGTAGEAAVMKALSARQKAAESDKWMALARTGAAIMASKSPTLGGAIGEGLGVGLESLSKSKKQAQDYEIAMAKVKASMARASKSGGLTANQRIDALMDLRNSLEQSLLVLPEDDPRRLGIDMRIESIDRQIAPYLGVSAGGTGSQKVKIS